MQFEDPMRKREEFAVSLRKKRTKAIIQEKRLKRQTNENTAQLNFAQENPSSKLLDQRNADYDGYDMVLNDKDKF